MSAQFDYQTAFSRNLGWLTPTELELLRSKKIAIAGLGGVGGNHLLTHTRLGVECFSIADFDAFELANFNRQVGASMSSLGEPKAHVLKRMAQDINPNLTLDVYDHGLSEDNLDNFFQGVDLFIDGLDFFTLDIRAKAFDHCHRHRIPAITCAPLGLGVSMLIFMPDGPSFEEYFRLEGHPVEEQYLRFLTGLSPFALHRHALVDPSFVDLDNKKGPSVPIGAEFCAALCATNTLKILLGRGDVFTVPKGVHFDAYTHTFKISNRPFGAYHPKTMLTRWALRRLLK